MLLQQILGYQTSPVSRGLFGGEGSTTAITPSYLAQTWRNVFLSCEDVDYGPHLIRRLDGLLGKMAGVLPLAVSRVGLSNLVNTSAASVEKHLLRRTLASVEGGLQVAKERLDHLLL